MALIRIGRSACLLAMLSACADSRTSTVQSINAVPLNNVQPVYPPTLQALGLEGSVRADCSITVAGTTGGCHILSAIHPLFERSALSYVDGARYRPATRDGVPVRVEHHVFNIDYVLYRITSVPVIAHYECAVDRFGVVGSCVIIDRNPPVMPDVIGLVRSLRLTPSIADNRAVADPARRISVAMSITSYPEGAGARLPPSDLQIDTYISCRNEPVSAVTEQSPRCTRIIPANPSSINRSNGEVILKVSLGFSGLVPSRRGALVNPTSPSANDASPLAPPLGKPRPSLEPRLG